MSRQAKSAILNIALMDCPNRGGTTLGQSSNKRMSLRKEGENIEPKTSQANARVEMKERQINPYYLNEAWS
jgi:hypothetical protein